MYFSQVESRHRHEITTNEIKTKIGESLLKTPKETITINSFQEFGKEAGSREKTPSSVHRTLSKAGDETKRTSCSRVGFAEHDSKDVYIEGEEVNRVLCNQEQESGSTIPSQIIAVGKHRKTQKEVAIKIIDKARMTATQIDETRDLIKMYQLAGRCQYVISMEDYFENREYFYLCLELLSDQTLHSYIAKLGTIIDERRARDLIMKIGQGMQFLHDHGVILRNFSAHGVLMTNIVKDVKYETSSPRIFHLQKAIMMGYDDQTSGCFGDVRFRAPEVVEGKPYNFKADSWSLGIVLYYILTRSLPFESDLTSGERTGKTSGSKTPKRIGRILERHQTRQLQQSQRQGLDDQIIHALPEFDLITDLGHSETSRDLVKKLLQKDPEQRLDVDAALKHSWFNMNFDAANRSVGEHDANDTAFFEVNDQQATVAKRRSRKLERQSSIEGTPGTRGKRHSSKHF